MKNMYLINYKNSKHNSSEMKKRKNKYIYENRRQIFKTATIK